MRRVRIDTESTTRRRAMKRWTPAEDRALALQWGELSVRELRQKFGRTFNAIYSRATQALRLSARLQGTESLCAAAERCGFGVHHMRRILDAANVHYERPYPAQGTTPSGRPTGVERRRYDPLDVDEAVNAWLRTETMNAAAKRIGVSEFALRRWLRAAGVIEGSQKGKPRRIPSETIDSVVANHRRAA